MCVDSCDLRYASVESEGGVEGQRNFQASGSGREGAAGAGKAVGNSFGGDFMSFSFLAEQRTEHGLAKSSLPQEANHQVQDPLESLLYIAAITLECCLTQPIYRIIAIVEKRARTSASVGLSKTPIRPISAPTAPLRHQQQPSPTPSPCRPFFCPSLPTPHLPYHTHHRHH